MIYVIRANTPLSKFYMKHNGLLVLYTLTMTRSITDWYFSDRDTIPFSNITGLILPSGKQIEADLSGRATFIRLRTEVVEGQFAINCFAVEAIYVEWLQKKMAKK